MLEDASVQDVVSWGPLGDCFIVKVCVFILISYILLPIGVKQDMNEFAKSILPRLFRHSNFASFVRQLNKYDFHKVKNLDDNDNMFGEQARFLSLCRLSLLMLPL
jgi:osomolarity two-component system response regulator SKN7